MASGGSDEAFDDAFRRDVLEKLSKSQRVELRRLDGNSIQDIRKTLEWMYSSRRMSARQIAREVGKSPSFVWGLCRRLDIELRSPNEGKALAAPSRIRTVRHPFSGSGLEKSYLKGFAEGDLDVRKPSSNAVMVSSTTTHPAFASCFADLFRAYGPIYHYPIFDKMWGYRWKVASRLDNSFCFLLPSARKDYPETKADTDLFFSWLAGIVDTDGSVTVVHSGTYVKILLLISNQDLVLLHHVKNELSNAGYHPTGPYLQARGGQTTPGWGIRYNQDMWSLYLQRSDEVKDVLVKLPLRHEEKIMKKELALGLGRATHWAEVEMRILTLRMLIAEQVKEYVSQAEAEHKKRGLGQAT